MHGTDANFDVDRFRVLAEGGFKSLAGNELRRARTLRKRRREMIAAGDFADEIRILAELAELTADPRILRSLAFAFRRRGDQQTASRLAQVIAPPARRARSERKVRIASIALQRVSDPQSLQELTQAEAEASAAELRANVEVLSRLEEMIATRIGTAVRHIRSESVPRPRAVPERSIVYRRAYTKHWFEVAGAMDERLRSRFGDSRELVVFVKSSLELRVRPQLELLLSEQSGRGFRTPYYFGMTDVSGLQVAAWESFDLSPPTHFIKYSFEDQKRIVEAIAGINAVSADGTAPDLTRCIYVRPGWFELKRNAVKDTPDGQWQVLYDRTVEVMEHQHTLAARIESTGTTFLTHNDVNPSGTNIRVPEQGDIVIFDWEGATLGAPGADLWLLVGVKSSGRLFTAYVDRMAEHGFRFDVDQIRFTAEVLRGIRALKTGWRNVNDQLIELGLRLLGRHIGKSALKHEVGV